MVWNAAVPSNDGLLINAPGQIRANWDAIALGTDVSLLITNAKIAAAAGIVDTKLGQITTAGKVSGSAITSLTNLPAGAGTIPLANIPSTLTGKSADQLDAQEGSYYRNANNINAGLLKHEYGGIEANISTIAKGGLLVGTEAGAMGIKAAGTNGLFLKYDSSKSGGLDAAAVAGIPTNIQVFTSNDTWVKPAGISTVYVRLWGAGGDAGNPVATNSGGGGGGGGYSEGLIAVTGNVTIVVGTGTSSFAGETTIQATAGSAGSGKTAGSGGAGSVGDVNLTGSNGTPGLIRNGAGGGDGGGSPLGGAGGGGGPGSEDQGNANGGDGTFPGGGGGGGSEESGVSGDGAGGLVIVMY